MRNFILFMFLGVLVSQPTFATFIGNPAKPQNGGSGVSDTNNATASSVANSLVLRDSGAGFQAGTISAALNGNASTATSCTNAATVSTTSNANFYPLFVASTTNSNQAHNLALDFYFNPSTAVLTLGNNGSQNGGLSLSNSGGSGALVTLQSLGATSAYNFNLPTTPGTSGQVLASAGGGSSSMTWSTVLANPAPTPTPSASGYASWDGNSNLQANSFLPNYTTTATAAGTTTLTVSSSQVQNFSGTTTQTVKLPVTSTLALGQYFTIFNNSTGLVTVESSGANVIQIMVPSSQMTASVILTSGTGTSSWNSVYSFAVTHPAGEVFTYASSTCPTGSIAADGTSYSNTTTYANLYTAVGHTWGGSGSNFNVPDLRGVFVRGGGTNGTYTNSNGTAFAGASLGTVQNDMMQGHFHSLSSASGIVRFGFANTYNIVAGSNGDTVNPAVGSPTSDGSNGTPRTGAETRPVNLSMTYCIWY